MAGRCAVGFGGYDPTSCRAGEHLSIATGLAAGFNVAFSKSPTTLTRHQIVQKFDSWEELLSAFRELGGIADNVSFQTVNDRRGIFPINPALPFNLFIPDQAIIAQDDVEIVDDHLVLKQEADVTPQVRRFFNAYHAFTSWTDGGKQEVEAFLHNMYGLPDQIKNLLESKFYFSELLAKPDTEKTLKRFVSTRRLTHRDKQVLFPVLELVNHGPVKTAFDSTDKGISLKGSSETEILAGYCLSDSWMRFKSYGFATRERWAFSDPFNVTPRDGSLKISVRNAPDEFVALPNGLVAPIIKRKKQSIDISFIIIGDRADPSVPVRLFRERIRKELGAGSDEFFETLSYINRMKFLELLRVCDGYDSPVVTTLKNACHYQLETLNNIWFGDWVPGLQKSS